MAGQNDGMMPPDSWLAGRTIALSIWPAGMPQSVRRHLSSLMQAFSKKPGLAAPAAPAPAAAAPAAPPAGAWANAPAAQLADATTASTTHRDRFMFPSSLDQRKSRRQFSPTTSVPSHRPRHGPVLRNKAIPTVRGDLTVVGREPTKPTSCKESGQTAYSADLLKPALPTGRWRHRRMENWFPLKSA